MINFNYDKDAKYETGAKLYDAFSRSFYHTNGRKLFDSFSGECFYESGKKAYDHMWGDVFYDNGHRIFDRFWSAVNKYNGDRIESPKLRADCIELAPNVTLHYNGEEHINYRIRISDSQQAYLEYCTMQGVAKFQIYIDGQCLISKAKYIWFLL